MALSCARVDIYSIDHVRARRPAGHINNFTLSTAECTFCLGIYVLNFSWYNNSMCYNSWIEIINFLGQDCAFSPDCYALFKVYYVFKTPRIGLINLLMMTYKKPCF